MTDGVVPLPPAARTVTAAPTPGAPEPTPAPPPAVVPPQKPVSVVRQLGEQTVAVIAEALSQQSGDAALPAAGRTTRMDHFKPLVNLGAAAILFYGFYLFQTEFMRQSRDDRMNSQQQARDDRTMFREGLNVMHADSDRKWQAINSNQTGIAEMAKALHALQLTQLESTKALNALQTSQTDIAKTMLTLQQATTLVGDAVREMTVEFRRAPGQPLPAAKPVPAKAPGPESRGPELIPAPKEAGG